MAFVDSIIPTRLLGDSNITAIVGKKIRPHAVKGEAMPYILFRRILTSRVYTFDGATGLADARLAVECWAKEHGEALELAELIRKRLNAFSGTLNGIEVSSLMLIDEDDAIVTDNDGTGVGPFGIRQEYRIYYIETN